MPRPSSHTSVSFLNTPVTLTYRDARREIILEGIPFVVILVGGVACLVAKALVQLFAGGSSGQLDYLGGD